MILTFHAQGMYLNKRHIDITYIIPGITKYD